jgi:hypothetical protein
MRDALKIEKNQPIIVEGVKYKLDSFYYMEDDNQVYVKCFNVKEKNFLNMKIEEFVKHWTQWRIKY